MNVGELVLGIDGGGSKTVAWLSKAARGATAKPVGRGAAGPSNPGVVGLSQTIAAVEQAIDGAFADAGVTPGLVAAACLAISGTEHSAHREAILDWAARRSLASNVQLVGDAEAVLAGGTRDRWGIALIAGTGSFAIGRDLQGLTVRVGGWGHVFGDEGSGHALGIAALRAATQHADGRAPATILLPRLLDMFALSEPRELVTLFYRGRRPGDGQHAPRASVSQLAPLVTAAAAEGDPVALQLASLAAADLARLVITACDRLHLPPCRFPLAITGGVLCNSPLMRTQLEAALAAHDHLTHEITLVEQPVQGAVELARRGGLE